MTSCWRAELEDLSLLEGRELAATELVACSCIPLPPQPTAQILHGEGETKRQSALSSREFPRKEKEKQQGRERHINGGCRGECVHSAGCFERLGQRQPLDRDMIGRIERLHRGRTGAMRSRPNQRRRGGEHGGI